MNQDQLIAALMEALTDRAHNPAKGYPSTPLVDDNAKYKPDVLRALREYRRSRPWKGTLAERKAKLATLHGRLCDIYHLPVELDLSGVNYPETRRANGYCNRTRTAIRLKGKLSVITYLHEFAHALHGNEDEHRAVTWSLSLFKRIFPNSYKRLVPDGHRLIKPEPTLTADHSALQ